jgi:hypothetical protein
VTISVNDGVTATAARGEGHRARLGRRRRGHGARLGGAGVRGACVEGAAAGQNRTPCERLH